MGWRLISDRGAALRNETYFPLVPNREDTHFVT